MWKEGTPSNEHRSLLTHQHHTVVNKGQQISDKEECKDSSLFIINCWIISWESLFKFSLYLHCFRDFERMIKHEEDLPDVNVCGGIKFNPYYGWSFFGWIKYKCTYSYIRVYIHMYEFTYEHFCICVFYIKCKNVIICIILSCLRIYDYYPITYSISKKKSYTKNDQSFYFYFKNTLELRF
jgi:hypothetical protein